MSKEIEALILRYVTAAKAHGEATENGDYKTTNKNYSIIVDIHRKIKSYGSEGYASMLPLLKWENQSVRCWAGAHLLKIEEKVALEALEKLSNEEGIISFDAEMVLQEWRNGNLRNP